MPGTLRKRLRPFYQRLKTPGMGHDQRVRELFDIFLADYNWSKQVRSRSGIVLKIDRKVRENAINAACDEIQSTIEGGIENLIMEYYITDKKGGA